MKAILIIVLCVGLTVYGLYYFLSRHMGMFKPILPTVFFEPPDNSRVITLDFGACAPGKGMVSGGFGSIKIEIYSLDTDTCLVNYSSSTEGEKPWTRCLVPRSLDKKTFEKNYDGVDFSEINKYCRQ